MKRFVFFCIIFGLFTSTYALGVEPAGSGTTEDPWQIDSLANLAWISETPVVWGDHFIQTSDIEAAETRNWNVVDGQPQGFVPIGNFLDGGFSGVYNGRGYKIRDLFINQPQGAYIGLFGGLDSARIDSLGLVRAHVRGWAYIGIVSGGATRSKITNSFAEGFLFGGFHAGALMGGSTADTIENSFASVHISTTSGGGLIGNANDPVIKRTYFAGTVLKSDKFSYSSIALGSVDGGGIVEDCFFLGEVFGDISVFSSYDSYTNTYAYQSTYKADAYYSDHPDTLTPEMKQRSNYTTYDFVGDEADGTEDVWNIEEGVSLPYLDGVDAPVFAFADTLSIVPYQGAMTQSIVDALVANDVDPDNPTAKLTARWIEGSRYRGDSVMALYQAGTIIGLDTMWAGISSVVFPKVSQEISISNYEDLKHIGWIAMPLDGEYRLTADVDAKESYGENLGQGFNPIARIGDAFRGKLHGDGHSIRNMKIYRIWEHGLGLFSEIDGVEIDSLGLVNVDINGKVSLGSIAGLANDFVLSQVYALGRIMGERNVGGLIGETETSQSFNLNIINSFFSGQITGRYPSMNSFGGLVGIFADSIQDSYANVFLSDPAGDPVQTGAACGDSCDFLSNYYWDANQGVLFPQNEEVDVMGATGLLDTENFIQSSYAGWDFTGNSQDGSEDIWAIVEGRSMPYLVGLDNPPFALPDTMELGAEDLSAMSGELIDSITANDIDPDDPTAQLTIRWTDKSDVFGDTLKLYYQVGSLIAGDTTWGAFSWVVFTGAPYPLVINTYEDLKKIGNPDFPLWTLAASYELGSDIDASESITENGGAGFKPIGSLGSVSEGAFSGVFDGKGHVISNLHIGGNQLVLAFFMRLMNATVKNLGLINAKVSGSSDLALLAVNVSHSRIQSVYVEGEVQGLEFGGMMAKNSEYSVYENCYAGGVLDVSQYASGFFHYTTNDTIRNSYSTVHLPHINDNTELNLFVEDGAVGTFLSNTYAYEDKVNYVNRDNAIGYPTFDFENIWAIREDSTMPALRSVNNAPFAFDDVDSVGASLDMRYLLANDFDYEKVQDSLVYKILEPENLALTWNYFIPGNDYAVGDSLLLRYRAGELLASGDTLWGNMANAKLYFKQNTRPISTTATYETEMNTPLVLPLDSLGYDPDGDARFYAVAYHPYFGEEQFDLEQGVFVYTPDSAFTGSDSLQFSVGDGEYNMTAWMYINVLDTSEVDTTDQTPSIMNVVTNGENVSKIRLENNQLWIQVQQAKIGRTKVEMFSVSGRMIREHDFGIVEAGSHNLYVDMAEIEPSVYYVILYRNGQVSQAKSVIYTGQ